MKKSYYKTKVIITFAVLLISFSTIISADNKEYAVVSLKGTVNPVVAGYIEKSIKKAYDDNCEFVILTIDTPGGLVTSTREIVQAVMNSKIPVITYTYPKGAQAASAGGFIMLSGNINAMSPGTEIGAMHPVSPMLNFSKDKEKKDNVMEEKVLNDITAFGKSIAEKRGKNVKWTYNAIHEKRSSTYTEALNERVIDYIAEDIDDLLNKLNGKKILFNSKEFVFRTDGLIQKKYNMKGSIRFLNRLADPNIIFILLIVAVAGIWIEIKNPGMIIPGSLGAASLLLFLLASKVIPINIFGIILLISAVVLFILEIYITSFGLLTLGGIAAFVSGALILFDSPLEGFSISYSTIAVSVVIMLVLVLVILKAIINTHREKVSTGRDGLIGNHGTAYTDIDASGGKVYVHGEYWNAYSENKIPAGENIEVLESHGMRVKVKVLE